MTLPSYPVMGSLTAPLTASLLLVLAACAAPLTRQPAADSRGVIMPVRQLAEQIRRDLAHDGPSGWRAHFSHDSGFFMASDGQLVFASFAGADSALPGIARVLKTIDLQWQDLRIDSLSPSLAMIGSSFTERLTDSAGHVQDIAGYFTAVAERDDSAWRLRNLHWSLVHDPASH